MNEIGDSDRPIVPAKATNKAEPEVAESLEERGLAKGNESQKAAARTQGRKPASTGLARVREVAKKDKEVKFTALLHHLTTDLLRTSYYELKRDVSPGVDGVTWQEYGIDLEVRLADLKDRVHSGRYRAQPSKRKWIGKADGRQRPLGIPATEDKVVQRAVQAILEQIYEEDFLGFSYGFRPGRHQHKALDAVSVGITRRKVSWVLDADIRGYFDAISHEWLLKFLEHRIADRRMLRLIQKWLRVGTTEDGEWSRTTVGTPQGGVISPLLANVFLHYALDLWIEAWRQKARGDVIVVRFADDFLVGFQYRDEAERCLRELRMRLAKFGLELHPEKTRLIEFGRFAASNRKERGLGRPDTFDFLGVTHYCSQARKSGRFIVKRKSSSKRLRRKLTEISKELRSCMHHPVPEQGEWLRSVVRGWFQYHAFPHNMPTLQRFRAEVVRRWYWTLRRRSQKGRRLRWRTMARFVDRWIPRPKILHPYPTERLIV